MSMHLTGLCREHSFETAAELCRRCGFEYCATCVVYPFGVKKPFCKTCAVAMSGVRSSTGLAAMSPRLVKKRAKAFAAQLGISAGAPTTPRRVRSTTRKSTEDPLSQPELNFPPRPEPDQAPASADENQPGADVAPPIDWSQPFD